MSSNSSTEEEAVQALLKGHKFYCDRNYTAAIAEYTRALRLRNVSSWVRICTLINRAGARERIGGTENLELALQDARAMIQRFKDQPEGYSCAARIHQLLDDDKSALDVLKYGIKQMKPESLQLEV